MPDIEAMLDNCQRMVGELPTVSEHKALREANADLLAALKNGAEMLEYIIKVRGAVDGAQAELADMRAAIAKAEGRAS